MTEGQVKALVLTLWKANKASREAGDKLMDAGLMLSDAEPMNAVFATAANTISDILSCYGLEGDEPFEKLLEAEQADDVSIILEVIERAEK